MRAEGDFMSKVFIERTFSYTCTSRNLCIELLEKIDEDLSLDVELFAEFKHNKLIFRVIGFEPAVESAMKRIRDYINQFLMLKTLNPKNGISAEQLAKVIRKTIPLDVLAEVLKRQGIANVTLRGAMIYADTDLETIQMYAQRIAKAMEKVSNMRYSHNLKKLIITAITLYNVDVHEILDVLSENNVISDEMELKVPWQEALNYIEEKVLITQ